MARLKKRYLIPGILVFILSLVLFFLSDFAKSYIEKNSKKLVGRKLTIGELHFNYLKAAVQVKDLVLFEDNDTDAFLSFRELYVNFDPWTLPSGEYSFSEIRLVDPSVKVIQNGEKFNFDSLMPKEDSTAVKDTTSGEPLKFTVKNIKLIEGNVVYFDVLKKSSLELKNLNLDLPVISWNNEQSDMGVDFRMGENGRVNIQAVVDNLKKKYTLNINTQSIDIQPVGSYLTDYFEVQALNGYLTSNLKIVGDMNEVINIAVSGSGFIDQFSVTDGRSENIISAAKVSTTIREMNLKTFHFAFGKIQLDQPKLLVVRDKSDVNIMQFFAPYFRSDSTAQASEATSQEPGTPVTYRIDTIRISNGTVNITDNTLNRPFNYDLNDLNATMTGLSENADQIPVEFSTKLNNKGELTGKTTWSMLDFMKLNMTAKIKRMDLVSFSPYTEYYVASPITQGWFNYNFGLKMTPTLLENQNSVRVDELEFGKKTKDTTAVKVPVRLALYIMKDANDVIKFDLPVTGNPSEPKFKLGRIIWKTFANLMVKTALSPFNALAGLAGTNPESIDKLPFAFAQDSLDQSQRDALSKLATILKKKPQLIIEMTQSTDPEKEKTRIAVNLAKAGFLKSLVTVPEQNLTVTPNPEDTNPDFLAFLKKSVPETDSIGTEKACEKIIGTSRIEATFNTILEKRNQLISNFMTTIQGIPAEAIQVSTADLRTLPQELKVPQFKVEVSIK